MEFVIIEIPAPGFVEGGRERMSMNMNMNEIILQNQL